MSNENKVVEAQSFLLKDSSGNLRAELSLRSGFPQLVMYDDRQRMRLDLSLDATSAGISLFDESGHCRIQAAIEQDRPGIATPTISLGGEQGKGGIVLYIAPDGLTGILFLDKNHEPKLDFPNQPAPTDRTTESS